VLAGTSKWEERFVTRGEEWGGNKTSPPNNLPLSSKSLPELNNKLESKVE